VGGVLLQIVLADAFDDMEGVETADVRAAIEAPTTLKAVSGCSDIPHRICDAKCSSGAECVCQL
jgi:hypothetical protein